MGDISKNFSLSEFVHSEKAITNGINNVISSADIKLAIQKLVETILQPLRNSLGASVVINSGYRSEELNFMLGGAKTSQHRKGEAADIRSPFYQPIEIARRIVALKLPFDQLILYPGFVHVSHKVKGKQRGQILYNDAYKGDKI